MNTRHLDDLQRALATIMRVILALSLVAVLVLGTMMLRAVWSSSTQGEVYYIAGGMLVITVMIVERLVRLRGR